MTLAEVVAELRKRADQACADSGQIGEVTAPMTGFNYFGQIERDYRAVAKLLEDDPDFKLRVRLTAVLAELAPNGGEGVITASRLRAVLDGSPGPTPAHHFVSNFMSRARCVCGEFAEDFARRETQGATP
jgi:hypothetical protein